MTCWKSLPLHCPREVNVKNKTKQKTVQTISGHCLDFSSLYSPWRQKQHMTISKWSQKGGQQWEKGIKGSSHTEIFLNRLESEGSLQETLCSALQQCWRPGRCHTLSMCLYSTFLAPVVFSITGIWGEERVCWSLQFKWMALLSSSLRTLSLCLEPFLAKLKQW